MSVWVLSVAIACRRLSVADKQTERYDTSAIAQETMADTRRRQTQCGTAQ
jgi:hypothetical protein